MIFFITSGPDLGLRCLPMSTDESPGVTGFKVLLKDLSTISPLRPDLTVQK